MARGKIKEAYWSAAREDNIITDVSVYRPGQSTYWFLWVIECKDLGKYVPADDIEEFHNKLGQINAHKGTMASRKGFAKGCTTYVKNKGIGLFLLTPKVQKRVLNERHEEQPSPADFVQGFDSGRMPGCFAV